ncbi:MAG: discoidin domain-containing protein [Pirellulales bacterium]|nr:discoidin domain-containing protein [Pirellulales bacterium]
MSYRFTAVSAVLALSTLLCGQAFGAPETVQVRVRVDSEAPGYEGYKALDGDPATMWHTRWEFGETLHPHEIVVDLGAVRELTGFAYLPRPGGGNGTIKDYEAYVSADDKDFGKPVVKGVFAQRSAENVVLFPSKTQGRYLRLRALSEVAGRPWTSIAGLRILCEGVTFRATSSDEMLVGREPVSELEQQFVSLKLDLRNRAHFQRVAPQVHHQQALILPSDRDPVDVVLRRTAALLANLKQMASAPDLSSLEAQFQQLQADNSGVSIENEEQRLALFEKVCEVRRKIALSNPLLRFDEILFIKRHRPGFNHMCDQYYGIHARPGGGLYVLHDPFGPEPRLEDVLADATVRTGRLEGQKLQGGSFVSPDLSYDAGQIAFGYVECDGDRSHRFHTDPAKGHWSEGWSYHVFRVNTDGTGLEQLTDGTWNDFDPCWLPNGRLAFITERRGGYLRCGRVCPTYTLFDMRPDGSDIRCLSFHETNEWHPSVSHDGRIIYTRWDYVDRHGCTAHLPWITTLDGRDSRAVHGNFAPRQLRPDMELDIRAIPGSHKYVSTAAPHHGQAFGSLVVVDPRIEDDDAMAPVRRITPEVAFPETQGGAEVYGTPWPLSEDYFLCVYDASMQRGAGARRKGHLPGNYGIYLVDAFGNKELIYRDPAIACQSPIPLRPRPVPPTMPELATKPPQVDPDLGRPAPGAEEPLEGTVVVINCYDSLKPWPEKTKVSALRVLQVLPMTVPSGSPPHETGLRLPSAGDSVVPCRYVLGTVPVEEDGSAHFTVPAHKEIFFQALGEDGLAVQSMRSATYVQAGERLVCQGCHERKHRAPPPPPDVPLALRRGPSRLQPDVDGSNPFSYPRLVQPVLDKHCVTCHAEHPDQPPNLAREPIQRRWYASYLSLAPQYGFYDYGNGHRTSPGRFGARASKLYEILQQGHYDVKLSEEELHRLGLWLDCCSMFYGVYEAEGGQAQLQGKTARPTLQ